MATIAELKERLDAARETWWSEPAPEAAVEQLERLLGMPASPSLREFLLTCGAGGETTQEISGILDGNPGKLAGGGIYADTMFCREQYGLPSQYMVIFFDQDAEAIWCLDTSAKARGGEYPVVSFEPLNRKPYPLFPSFAAYFEDYVKVRSHQ
jgi:antitoxin YobK